MNELSEDKIKDRLAFLAKKFDIFESDKDSVSSKISKLEKDGFKCLLHKHKEKILAITYYSESSERPNKTISVSFDVFSDIIGADPTKNKSCVQWMLNVFVRFLKIGDSINIEYAIRFVIEDLPQASEYIKLFEANKRKNKFKALCKHSHILKHINDVTDINQYKSLSQLFDAVDPFIEREPSELESLIAKYVESGQAEVPVNDRKFLLFIPKTRDASVIFGNFANWCTAKPDNGMFAHYTDYRTPDGNKSKIYIIINKKFFANESSDLYQIHFETNQIKDRHNSQNVSIFNSVISESQNISNFFYEELIGMARANKIGLESNKYVDFLIKFGFCESLFELIDDKTPTIRFMTREIPRLPDISKFKMLDQLIITNANLHEIHPSIGELTNLEMLVLTENKIKILPKEIGNLNKLTFINIIGNPIKEIPEEIKYLDKSNGGSLFRMAVKKEHIGEKNYNRLKELLPSVKF
jgi:hypothetical protein